jgi:peptide deformylase
MQVITLGDDILRQKAEKVKKIDEEVAKTAALMLEMLKTEKGVGLAGPQIGLLKRIFVVHINKDIDRVFINPSIIETSSETIKVEEGCLSIPGIYANVVRSKSIKVQAWNEKSRPFTLEAEGLLARVILHEYDHLEGVLFLDRLSDAKREKLAVKYEKLKQKKSASKKM